MKGKQFYAEVQQFVKPIWVSIFTMNIIINIITQVMATFVSSLYTGIDIQVLLNQMINSYTIDIAAMTRVMTAFSVMSILSGIVGRFVLAALTMAILQSYRTREKIKLNTVWSILQEHFSSIAAIGIITSFISVLLIVTPGVQMFASIIILFVDLFFAFAYLLVYDKKAEDGVSALRLSASETRGHKFNLFKISFRYTMIIFSGFAVIVLGAIIAAAASASFGYEMALMGVTVMVIGFGMMVFFSIKYSPYLIAAPVVYYENIEKENAL